MDSVPSGKWQPIATVSPEDRQKKLPNFFIRLALTYYQNHTMFLLFFFKTGFPM